MNIVIAIGTIILSYLIGSIQFELLTVKWRAGIDIRHTRSGRIGGTNAMRAAGYPIGVLTLILDVLRGALAVWLARGMLPGEAWLTLAAPLVAISGHNYSVFLIERDDRNRLHLGGGAGGATSFGGAIEL